MTLHLLTLRNLDVKGKKVVVRVDFNVPQDKEGNITDDTRIREALPSIEMVLQRGGSPILLSHLGRPQGKPDPKYTLLPIRQRLQSLLGVPVLFANNLEEAKTSAERLQPGEVLLVENLRFDPAEETPELDPSFARRLAALGDCYVNDAFGTAHRAHSSTTLIAHDFPGKAVAGLLMEKEVSFLSRLTSSPERPFYAIIGGAKVSSKIGVLESLLSKVDGIFIGGAMAYTFFKAQGLSIGNSLFEDAHLATAKKFLESCKQHNIPLWLPIDTIIARAPSLDAERGVVALPEEIPDGWVGMDIGPKTLALWSKTLSQAKTIFWNGPLGVFELPPFALGTEGIARALSTLQSATTIVGGGDSVAAVNSLGISKKFSHISTGGGASLEFIEFGKLPGIIPLLE